MDTIPAVDQIRAALEKIPGAVEDIPQIEEGTEGFERGTPVQHFMPRGRTSTLALTESDADADVVDEVSDQPTIVFEVPPLVTDAEVRKILGNGIGDLKRVAQIHGIDAYGWYVSFHQRAWQHGIYIPAERLLAFALDVFSSIPLPLNRRLEAAFHAILRHELFHFETDCMAANWELSIGKPVYWPGRREPSRRELEEGLANAYMLRGFRYTEGALRGTVGCYRALGYLCKLQPPGYRDGPRYARSRAAYTTSDSRWPGTAGRLSSA